MRCKNCEENYHGYCIALNKENPNKECRTLIGRIKMWFVRREREVMFP